MFSKINKIISIILTIIFITGIFPPVVFAQPKSTPLGEVKGFNRTVLDSHFSRADRELNPERWLAEAKFGVTQAICAWELIAGSLYENPFLYEEAKAQIIKWSDEELEKRFSQWLMGRFFGKAAEEALINLSSMFNESQKYYSWHLDEEGNVIFDDKTGDPLVIRPNEEGREFSNDLTLWRDETNSIINTTSASFNNTINSFYPELLAYIPPESRESISVVINETFNTHSNVIKREFENIAAREERIFTNRRTRDIWSLRKKSDDEAAKKFTEKLIAETDESCKKGIEELNAKIEQASAGVGDLTLLGEEWLSLYKEQFERGLKAWEDAEERFFIRRIEWEQESFKLFSEGEAVWLSAFNQFEEERQKWELNAKELFQNGESLFINISEDFKNTIADAKEEFIQSASIRIGEGTNKVKALVDMYLISSSAAASSIENIKFWQKQFDFSEIDVRDVNLADWMLTEMYTIWKQTESSYLNDPEYIRDKYILTTLESPNGAIIIAVVIPFSSYNYDDYLIEFNEKHSELIQIQEILEGNMSLSEQIAFARNINSKYFPKNKFEALFEVQNSYNMYLSYIEKSLDARNRIYNNYAELFGTGALKDILSSDVSSDDFNLDEYQIALIRAKALVLYWERKTSIAEAVMAYASELGAGRMTEAEGIKAWEEAKTAYNNSLTIYESELSKLNKIGNDIQEQQLILNKITLQMQIEEEKLNNLYSDYSSLFSMSVGNMEEFFSLDFNTKYNNLVIKYNNYQKTGADSVYFSTLEYGLLWEMAEQQEIAETIKYILETNNELSEEEITEFNNYLTSLSPEFQSKLWDNTCNALSQLFSDYNLQTTTIFPDVQSFCVAILLRPGDFMENTAKFLTDFDNCLPTIHLWLQYEINNWKESIISYITTFAFFNNIQPENTTTKLTELYDDLLNEYNALYQAVINNNAETSDDGTDQINIDFKNIYDKLRMFVYINKISESWEQIKLIASSENKKHWRQYLLNEYIVNKDPPIVMVSSWEAGVLEDALYYASYYTNRINDSFDIYSLKDNHVTNINSEILNYLYSEQISKITMDFNLLNSQYNEIINAVKLLEYSKLSPNDIKNQISSAEEEISNQESVVDLIRNNYFYEANIFLNIGSQYDSQYNILKTAYNNVDQKRFEYEKQDAIQRWASTSYINTDNIDPASCKANLVKAQTVLSVLSDISNNTNNDSNINPKYEALYAAYEQSFSKKIKVNEAIELISSAYMKERINNENIYQKYQNSLYQLGINFNYQNYDLPESKSDWKIENIITIKNGRLAFSKDESMNLIGVNSTEVIPIIEYFNNTESVNCEYIDISDYEEALRGLSQRLSIYLNSQEKFKQWSYARNYLLLKLKNKNNNVKLLDNYLSVGGELNKGGSLASSYIKLRPLEGLVTLSYYMEINYYKNNDSLFQDAWDSLSEEEKADLEFYVILTLTTGNDYFAGFKEIYNIQAYEYIKNKAYSLYREAQNVLDTWYRALEWGAWTESRDVNKSTYNRITSFHTETVSSVYKWIDNLNNSLISIKNLTDLYNSSCNKLHELEGTNENVSNIIWDDINSSFSKTTMKLEDINTLHTCWEKMLSENTNTVYNNVFEALIALQQWTDNEVYYAKYNLETSLYSDMENKRTNEEAFLSIIDDYFKGTADINAVKIAANKAYGENTISIKYYLDNMYDTSINNLSMYMTTNFNFNSLFNKMGEEIVSLTGITLNNKYNAELSAREVEWDMMKKDINEKYNEWQNTAAKILENGRTDWTESYKKLENAYKQWYLNLKSEYERVNNEWIYAYLAGLEDKEEWLRQASDAANQASSESFLSLIGTEGERLSRFLDTKEPLGIRDAIPQAQALMSDLLQSSGIVNMAKTFNSLNNFTNITSPLVKRGVGGASTWDSALVKITASDLARKANTEISKNESKKLAYNARIAADEVVKSLYASVDTANQNVKNNIDNIFIFKGLWRKNGNNYIKDIIKGSTLFQPIISKTVTITGYINYPMEPVILKTNLEENYLASLDSIAIQGLINNIYIEVQTIAEEIFGNGKEIIEKEDGREQTLGKFGTHVGCGPTLKQLKKATTNRNEIFDEDGSGEMGRLMSDFYYWDVIDKTGSAQLSLAPWDKRMWNDDGSWFTAPSLRTVGTIAGSIAAGIVTGGAGLALSVGLSSASEITFGMLDLFGGYKSLDEVAFNMGKTILTNTVTFKLGAAFNGIQGTESIGLTRTAMNNAGTDFSKVFAQTMMTGAQTFTTGFATSAMSAFTYDSKNGFGYSGEIFTAGMKGMLTNSLVSMTGTFTSTGLTALNSGLDYSKLDGCNIYNQTNLQTLNGLIGSLAGQGVNYALGNDFTLNVLNLSLIPGKNYNSGLLELHIGHNGVKMNIGTGGANVSIDNLVNAYRGAQVWDVNTKITNYGKKNDFDALAALRAQYGYGDDVQKNQLWDILKGETLINTNVEGDYVAQTTINEDGKRVINLAGYEKGMNKEEQFLLGTVLGYEAYRNGYTIEQTDASGNLVTYTAQTEEFRSAHIAKLLMGDRIQEENKWFYEKYEGLTYESILYGLSKLTGDFSVFDDYLDLNYNNSKDYLCISVTNGGDYQNYYTQVPLLNSAHISQEDAVNKQRLQAAFEKYISEKHPYIQQHEYQSLYDDFIKNNDLQKKYGYRPVSTTTLAGYGCTFMSIKNGIEGFTNEKVNILGLHEFVKKNNYIIDGTDNLLSNVLMADIMTAYTDNRYNVTYMSKFQKWSRIKVNGKEIDLPEPPSIETINTVASSDEKYIIHLRIKNPNKYWEGTHSVMVNKIDYTYDDEGKINGIDKIYVANSLLPSSHINTKTSYSPDEIFRWDFFKVTKK